jgi:hypothetical protein
VLDEHDPTEEGCMQHSIVRRGARAGLALGAATATLVTPPVGLEPASAHETGDHGNLHIGGGTCLEARNHFEEGHHRTTGYGGHILAKSESSHAVSVAGVDLCPGIAYGLPRGHLYARYELLLYRDGQWWQCLNVAEYSTGSGQWSLTVQTDSGEKAPCIDPNDRRGYWYANQSSHYYLRNGSWLGSWLVSGSHILHNP